MDLAVVSVATIPVVIRAGQLGVLGLCLSPSCLTQAGWWASLAGIVVNYAMHGFIWNRPETFTELSKKAPLNRLGGHPVDVFAGLEVVAKLVQLTSLVLFLGSAGRSAAYGAVFAAPGWCWLMLASFVVLGQVLNFAMYAAIGNAGVYYGFKLGKTVPWCSGFPFNVGLRHPQYVGVVLTLWGVLMVALCEELAKMGFPQLIVAWGSMYFVMCAMEQLADNDKSS